MMAVPAKVVLIACVFSLFQVVNLLPHQRLRRQVQNNNGQYRVVCYYTSWSSGRASIPLRPAGIPPNKCTHIIFAFGDLATNGSIKTANEKRDLALYRELETLKEKNPSLKTLLALGGLGSGSWKIQSVFTDDTKKTEFLRTVATYLRKHKFDGLDLDWEYPNNFKALFSKVVRELKEKFKRDAKEEKKPQLLLSGAFAAGLSNIDNSYDLPTLSAYFDFWNIMSYDLRGFWWPKKTGLHSGLYASSAETTSEASLNVNWVIEKYVKGGVPKDKIVLGIPFYGRSMRLCEGSTSEIGQPICGMGAMGPYLHDAGILSYSEICANIQSNGWTRRWDNQVKGPFAYLGREWVGYDDKQSINAKVDYIKTKELGGGMVWELGFDNLADACDGKWPLLTTLSDGLLSGTSPKTTARSTTRHTTTRPPTTTTPVKSTTTTTWRRTTSRTTTRHTTTSSTTKSTPVKSTTTTEFITAKTPTSTATQKRTTVSSKTTSATTVKSTKNPCKITCDGNKGELLCNPENPKTYIQCLHGHPVVLHCPADLHFSYKRQACVWPHQASACECNTIGETAETKGTTPGGKTTPTPASTFRTTRDTGNSFVCPAGGPANAYYPVPESCRHYYWCANGRAYKMPCAPGTSWSDVSPPCDKPIPGLPSKACRG